VDDSNLGLLMAGIARIIIHKRRLAIAVEPPRGQDLTLRRNLEFLTLYTIFCVDAPLGY
jgi:hypothetical protein